jgi:radical SAM superfamily enzyme YgiQ (UPF0313 family)
MDNSIDLLLLFPPAGNVINFMKHLGMAYLQTHLMACGFRVRQYSPEHHVRIRDLLHFVSERRPRMIGFCCGDNNYPLVRILASELKLHFPHIKIVVGGPTGTFADKFILQNVPAVDLVVRGEGESAMQALLEGKPPDKIPGLSLKNNGKIVRNHDLWSPDEWRGMDSLDRYPSPYIDGIFDGSEGLGVFTARGCNCACTYCSFREMGRRTLRYHSIERVMEELRIHAHTLHSRQMDPQVDIQDDAFSLNPSRAKQLLEQIIKEDLRLHLRLQLRADFVDDEFLTLLTRSGVVYVNFGLESAVPRILRNVHKVTSKDLPGYEPEERFLEAVKRCVRSTKSAGIWTSVSVIFGLPGETPDDARKTLDFIRNLGVDSYSHNQLVIYSGTELEHTHKRYGIKCFPSITGLPVGIKYAYRVKSVERLPNVARFQSLHTHINTVNPLLTGIYDSSPDAPDIQVDKAALQQDSCWEWLKYLIGINNRFMALVEDVSLSRLTEFQEQIMKHNLPTIRPFLTGRDWGNSRNPLLTHYSYATDRKGMLSRYPYNDSTLGAPLEDGSYRKLLLSLDDQPSLEAFIEDFSAHVYANGVIVFKDWRHKMGVSIEDACRWSDEICPMLGLKRLLIDEHGQVRCCRYGPIVSQAQEPYELISEAVRRIYEETWEQRGCASCPVQDRCSRCPFLSPQLDAKGYCELRRRYPAIGKYVRFLNDLSFRSFANK